MMDASPHPSLKLLVLFLVFSHAFSAASALPAARSIKEDAMEIEPFKESARLVGTEFVEGEGRMEMELEVKNDYPDPGPNPHHYPPPNPSKSTP